jgi:hypothetical protein
LLGIEEWRGEADAFARAAKKDESEGKSLENAQEWLLKMT